MSADLKTLHDLTPEQKAAAHPESQIWLSASAGTGKTQVLTARVLRLLLTPRVRPENLLCITFTKAGAAEMKERINERLARWVQMKSTDLAIDLRAIGADEGPANQNRARQLFASVLDAPGGGLQITTIHALAQSLLASFPEEAGLTPGFLPIEGRALDQLYEKALMEVVTEAEESGNQALIAHLQRLSIEMGEEAAFGFLKKCAGQSGVMDRLLGERDISAYARAVTGVEFEGSIQEMLENEMSDAVIDLQAIQALAEANIAWNTATGRKRAEPQLAWLAMDVSARAEAFDSLHYSWTSTKEAQFTSGPKDEGYHELILRQFSWSSKLKQRVSLARYAEKLASALMAGKAFSARFAEAKRLRGLIDFNDMINKTAELLTQGGMADWISFKLDRRVDHILVDEAQDTNRGQWAIIEKLSDDFFSGLGAKDEKPRTIFSVGDYKQAIFGFQGTDPQQYDDARRRIGKRIEESGSELHELSLGRSFRSTQPVIALTNALLETLPDDAMGDICMPFHNTQWPDIGQVELMKPVTIDLAPPPEDEEEWVPDEKRLLAERIAERVKALVDEAPLVYNLGNPRKLRAGDIMVLLRSRGELASTLIAQLHESGVAVAGIDRLKIQEPLVVQDLLAAIRFVLQPHDDYSLACLLVSPLFGWSQEKLLERGYRSEGIHLWDHLRNSAGAVDETGHLLELLRLTDFGSAYSFLENILSGPMKGRRKFEERLGSDALIPVEELLNQALQFEQEEGATLQAFLDWFDSGETQITRDILAGSDEVRVMTVHGAKGLQAPAVILADITRDPDAGWESVFELPLPEGKGKLPMPGVRKEERHDQLEHAVDREAKREAQEHLRLLYVAITRAQERLIMVGAMGERWRRKDAHPPGSWYPPLQSAMGSLGCDWSEDNLFGQVMRFSGADKVSMPKKSDTTETVSAGQSRAPAWLFEPAPEENSPPRPLVPSQIDDDAHGEPPADKSLQLAAERGRLAHMLFERISESDVDLSLANAARWLKQQQIPEGSAMKEIITMAEQVVRDPAFAEWFGPEARAEVPLAAVVGEVVVSGRVDRLLVKDGKVSLLDFKTGRAVPKNASAVPTAFLRQMAHYVAALEVIFPDHEVDAALLYSFAPKLIRLPAGQLDPYKPAA